MRASLPTALWLIVAPALHAQSPPAAERGTDVGIPGWMDAWSPLVSIADHPRRLPRAPLLPELLRAPLPRVGLFWTAGNPAGLGLEASSPGSELRATGAWDAGSFRRPLDGDDVAARQVSAFGWRRVGRWKAAAGRVTADEESLGMSAYSDVFAPYASNPLVVTDTSLPRMRRVRARLEGAIGRQIGRWGLGLTAGVEVRDQRTRGSRFPRLGRMSTPAVALGVGRELALGRLRLAASARWVGGSETISLFPQPGAGTVYQLEGYSEPDPREVTRPPPYFRRMDSDARSVGLAASGEVLEVVWAVFGERTSRHDGFFSERREDPARDRWSASGRVLGGAMQAGFLQERILVTVHARWSRLRGEATRSDLEGAIFRAEESMLWAATEVRYLPPRAPWAVAAAFTIGRERRRREDFIAEIESQIEGSTPGVGLELARSLDGATWVSAGFAVSANSAVSRIPNPASLGPVYQRLIAPELSLYATQAISTLVSLAIRRRVGTGAALYVGARSEKLRPRAGGSSVPFAPDGERRLASVSLAMIFGP